MGVYYLITRLWLNWRDASYRVLRWFTFGVLWKTIYSFEVRTIETEKRSVPELWTEVPALKIRSKVLFVLIFPATPTKTKNHLQSWFINRVGYIQRLGLFLKR